MQTINWRAIAVKKIILLLLFIVTTILFLFNSKVVLNISSNHKIDGSISYITPLSAEFEKGGQFPFTLNSGIQDYSINLNAKLIKKIKVDLKVKEQDAVIFINKAGIKLPYLPTVYFNIENPQKLDYNKTSVVFSNISPILIIVPLLLLLISVVSFIILFFNKIKSLLLSLKSYNHIFIGIVIFIILFEIVKFTGMNSNILGDNLKMFLYIFKSDSYFLSIFLMMLYVAVKVKSKYISSFIMLIFFAMVFTLVLDIALIELLSARLRFKEATGFVPDTASIIKMAKGFFITTTGIYSLILLIYVILFSIFIVSKKDLYSFSKLYKIILFALVVILAPLFMIKLDIKSYYSTALQDSIIVANMKKSEDVLYSQEKINEVLNKFKFYYKCVDGLNTRKNIIVVVVESLSSYNSQLFSDIENKTPNLDNIAKDNIYADNYYCNSYNSYQNRYNILTGSPLITRAKNYNINRNIFYSNSIVKDFQAKGYNVYYYSSADTVFDSTIKMVKATGIKSIYDANSKIFASIKKRFVFKGVEDKYFYETVIKHLNSVGNHTKPYLAFLTTMSTHGPYEDPETGEYSFDKTLKYADNQLLHLLSMLKKQDFFKDGILVITSDHRVMLPISKEEYDILGPLAHASIPLVIIDGDRKYKINGNFSHIDLGKSLEYLTLDKACFNQFQNNMFKENNGCVIYQQLINFALVDVKCGNSYGQVILDGDNTRFIKDNLNISEEKKAEIVEYLNYLRLAK